MLDGLAAYVRALSPAACSGAESRPIRAEDGLDDARRAVAAARAALAQGDRPTAALMVGAARSQLGLIYERYDAPALAADRDRLSRADQDLAAIAAAIRAGDPRVSACEKPRVSSRFTRSPGS